MRRMNLKKANVARANTIRHINRQIVLNYVREKEPISRAEISHETALQRSTVSLIVEELKTKGLIDEIEGESTGGRPPLLLRLRAGGPVAIGVDLGTAETSVATGDLAGRILKRETFLTDPDLKTAFKQIEACVNGFLSTEPGLKELALVFQGWSIQRPERRYSFRTSSGRIGPLHATYMLPQVYLSWSTTMRMLRQWRSCGSRGRRFSTRAILFSCLSKKAWEPVSFLTDRFIMA